MTAKTFKTIDNYINSQPESTKKKTLQELKECILKEVPNAIELFNYNIPAFALVKGDKREQQIMMAGYKNHIGFYPHPTVMEKFDTKLEDYNKGKGSVQFPINKPLAKELIIEMVTYRVSLLEKG